MTTATVSYCVVCDAEPGGCTHNTNRYLADITYEPVNANDWREGHKVPQHEQERWNASPLRPEPRPVHEEAMTVQAILALLEPAAYIDDRLELRIRDAYEIDPLRMSRLAVSISEAAASGQLRNAGGLLHTRVVELQGRKTMLQ